MIDTKTLIKNQRKFINEAKIMVNIFLASYGQPEKWGMTTTNILRNFQEYIEGEDGLMKYRNGLTQTDAITKATKTSIDRYIEKWKTLFKNKQDIQRIFDRKAGSKKLFTDTVYAIFADLEKELNTIEELISGASASKIRKK